MRHSSAALQGRPALLAALDSLFSALVVCPCVVAYWRSAWTLMDVYLTPGRPALSAALSCGVGLVGHVLFIAAQRPLAARFTPSSAPLRFYCVSRLYTVCYAFVCVNGWRGPWDLLTVQTQRDFGSLMVTSAVGLVALVAMRALRNVASPPCVIVNDLAQGYFDVLTMFRVAPVSSLAHRASGENGEGRAFLANGAPRGPSIKRNQPRGETGNLRDSHSISGRLIQLGASGVASPVHSCCCR